MMCEVLKERKERNDVPVTYIQVLSGVIDEEYDNWYYGNKNCLPNSLNIAKEDEPMIVKIHGLM